jgi:hypothetical protein
MKLMIEWLCYDREFGEGLKPFYLPVSPSIHRDSYRCYIFFLAPFVLMWYISYNVFMNIWFDLIHFSEMQIRLYRFKRK